ncbi:Carboxylate-amine ligase YbdK [Corynebacterium occultum]|uniref:Putative glutamate--cysteine ligase 2 n=1 Tax=Corynebacterium occultum TaxID=2675219 RepID=A0A6B8WHT3_9CORY|nr:glutamate--cysteine ligase [Corynebacterium occultum]QGU06078.1 Carboxylate-amine ligase YbdK [Corynebacterium occultum]
MRTFGVEEELLLVDAYSLAPLPRAESLVARHRSSAAAEPEITLEFKQEQIEVVSRPQLTFQGQLSAIRQGRELADRAAATLGGRVIALPTIPGPIATHLVHNPRFRRIDQSFGLTSDEQFTCAFHVHVRVYSREEAVAALDRVRVWLPTLMALSANSPFWQGSDTGFASYRYQAWNRWPMTGPTDYAGSVEAHDRHLAALLDTGVPLDVGMLYFDARLCDHQPTLEVRVTDVCMKAEHAAALAVMVRALVESAARSWQAELPAPQVSTSLLRAWSWRASRDGVQEQLHLPTTGRPAPAAEVVAALLAEIRPVLVEYGEAEVVEEMLRELLNGGSGAVRQREVFAETGDLREVLAFALETTHRA